MRHQPFLSSWMRTSLCVLLRSVLVLAVLQRQLLYQPVQGYVSFLEYEKQLVAIHIHSFSKLDIKSIRMDAITTIKDEIKSLALALKKKESIQNNIIEKRKLEFTEKMVANEFEKMKVNEL